MFPTEQHLYRLQTSEQWLQQAECITCSFKYLNKFHEEDETAVETRLKFLNYFKPLEENKYGKFQHFQATKNAKAILESKTNSRDSSLSKKLGKFFFI